MRLVGLAANQGYYVLQVSEERGRVGRRREEMEVREVRERAG